MDVGLRPWGESAGSATDALPATRLPSTLPDSLAQTLPPRLERQGDRPPPRALRLKRVVADEDHRPGLRPRANPFVKARCSPRP